VSLAALLSTLWIAPVAPRKAGKGTGHSRAKGVAPRRSQAKGVASFASLSYPCPYGFRFAKRLGQPVGRASENERTSKMRERKPSGRNQ